MKQDKQLLATSLKELQEKNEKLELYARELEDFIATVCHELQEPLRKIKSYGQLMQEKQTLSGETNTYFSHMIRGSEHAENLVLAFLELSKAAKIDLNLERVALNQVVENVLQQLECTIRETQASITIANTIPPVKADALQMHQVLFNILSNAIKFCKQKPMIIIHHDEYLDFVRLMIQDNGIGIPTKYIDKVFSPFFTIDSDKLQPETGAGLTICKKIIERHNGHIYAESSERLGTIIIIDLPMYQESEEELLA